MGSNDIIINLRITSKLPFHFTQSATQGYFKNKLRKQFFDKIGHIHANRDIINISQITSNIICPVLKSRHASEVALKHDHEHAATAHARFNENYPDVPTRGKLTMVKPEQ